MGDRIGEVFSKFILAHGDREKFRIGLRGHLTRNFFFVVLRTIEGECKRSNGTLMMARRKSKHVITLLKIEDDEGENGKLVSNVASVEDKAKRPLATGAPAEPSRSASPGPSRRQPGDGKPGRARRPRA